MALKVLSCRASRRAATGLLGTAIAVTGTAWAAAPAPGITALLAAQYAAWTPASGDTTPLATLRAQGLDWGTAAARLRPLYDDAHAYAELRGVARLPDGRETVGVLRAALYVGGSGGNVLLLNDEWCVQDRCRARTRFVLQRQGQPDTPLPEPKLVPLIADDDLIDGPVPDCLAGVTLGVQYLPSRYDTTLTALATVPPDVQAACDDAGIQVALVTRPLQLNWNAAARKFVRVR